MDRRLKRNILSLYIIKISKWFSLIMPIIVLFYQDNGLSMFQIFTLKSVYSVAMLSLEIPSGYLGDRWGRKKTLLTGSILVTIGFCIYSFSSIFLSFLIAEIILGFGQSFISGSDSAILYDTLKHYKKDGEYVKHEGRITSTGNLAEAIAGILAGVIATMSLRFPFILQTAIAATAIPASILLFDPFKPLKANHSLKYFWGIVADAYHRKKLRMVILLSSVTGCATLTFAWFVQPYLIALDIKVIYFGIIWTVLNISVAISSFFAYKLENRIGQQQSILLIITLIPILFISSGLWVSLFSLILLLLFNLLRGFATPVLKDYIHREIDSHNRATILSIRNMVIRLLFALLAPIIGWLTDVKSVSFSMTISGIFFLIAFTLIGISLNRKPISNR